MREGQARAFHAQANHDQEADEREVARGQGRAQATAPSANPRTRPVAGERSTRALRVLRGARQRPRALCVSWSGDETLASGASEPQPAYAPGLGAHGSPRYPMA